MHYYDGSKVATSRSARSAKWTTWRPSALQPESTTTHIIEDINHDQDGHARVELAKELLFKLLPSLCPAKFLIAGELLRVRLNIAHPAVVLLFERVCRRHVVSESRSGRSSGRGNGRSGRRGLRNSGSREDKRRASRTGRSL